MAAALCEGRDDHSNSTPEATHDAIIETNSSNMFVPRRLNSLLAQNFDFTRLSALARRHEPIFRAAKDPSSSCAPINHLSATRLPLQRTIVSLRGLRVRDTDK